MLKIYGLAGLVVLSIVVLASPVAKAEGPLLWDYRCIGSDDIRAQLTLYRADCAVAADDKGFRSSFLRPVTPQDPPCGCKGGETGNLPTCVAGEEAWACLLVAPSCNNCTLACGRCDAPQLP